MKIELTRLQPYIDKKLINVQKHPSADLWLYDYSQRCQFEQAWDEVTKMCRGLILDAKGNIVARPFAKFFNLEENKTDLPATSFEVTEKEDGSLGITYFINGEPKISTRGSFVSEQAGRANKMLEEHIKKYPLTKALMLPNYCCLWEIIYPENRIVIDYKGRSELILLAIINNETGAEVGYNDLQWFAEKSHLKVVNRYDGIQDYKVLSLLNEPNREGYVVHFFDTNNTRIKVKFAEYVRLHKIITGLSVKGIWEMLRDGKTFEEILTNIPDEFAKWVDGVVRDLGAKYIAIDMEASEFYTKKIQGWHDRKKVAEIAKTYKHPALMFARYDGKQDSWRDFIWKQVKPISTQTFKVDEN